MTSGLGSGDQTRRGFGLAATLPLDTIRSVAQEVSESGYSSFWLNNPPGTNALPLLAKLDANQLHLGVGVIPTSHVSPESIAQEVRGSGLEQSSLLLGIGSGGAGAEGIERVRLAIRELRASLQCRIVVAAMGPRMCRLAGAEADGVLFNWLTPSWARRSRNWVERGAKEAKRPRPLLMAYVRTALGQQALLTLEGEARRYEAIPAYAAHFSRMGASAISTAVTGETAEDIEDGLGHWNEVVDELVVRAVTASDSPEQLTDLVRAARPAFPHGETG